MLLFIWSNKMSEISKEEKLKSLNDLLINSNELNSILKYQNDINIFKILKTEKAEIRHSNVLAWLLNSAENHKLDDLFIKTWFGKITKENYNNIKEKFSIHRLILHSLNDFVVYREKWNIDILLVAEKSKQVVVIENKIDSGEHDNQLKRYEDKINQEFPDYEKLFIYLTPNLSEMLDTENWIKVGYVTVKESLEEVIFNIKDETIKLIINNYIEIIRSEVMEDNSELKELSLEIYKKYKIALDIIYEYKPDSQQNIKDIIDEILLNIQKQNQNILLLPSAKSYIRFTTKSLQHKSQNQGNEKWIKGMKDILVYEILNIQNYELCIKLLIGPSNNKELRNSFIETAKKHSNIFKYVSRGAEWTQIWKKTILTKNEIENDEYDFNELKEKIEKNIINIINDEVKEIDQIFN